MLKIVRHQYYMVYYLSYEYNMVFGVYCSARSESTAHPAMMNIIVTNIFQGNLRTRVRFEFAFRIPG